MINFEDVEHALDNYRQVIAENAVARALVSMFGIDSASPVTTVATARARVLDSVGIAIDAAWANPAGRVTDEGPVIADYNVYLSQMFRRLASGIEAGLPAPDMLMSPLYTTTAWRVTFDRGQCNAVIDWCAHLRLPIPGLYGGLCRSTSAINEPLQQRFGVKVDEVIEVYCLKTLE